MDERHVIWHLFTNPDARSFIVNWESHAKIVLSNFRVNARRYTNEAWFIQLVERLENISPEFRKWWSQHEVEKLPTSRREFNHPDVGRLVLEHTVWMKNDNPSLHLVLYTPEPGTDTAEKLQQLTQRTESL